MVDYFADLLAGKRSAKRKTDAELAVSGSWRLAKRKKQRRDWRRRVVASARVVELPNIPDVRDTVLLLPGYDPFAEADGYEFRPEAATAAIAWFHAHITHTKGAKARGPDPFILALWEQAFIGNLFGWFREGTNLRRYAEAFLGIGRGNGKTTLGAGLLNLVACCDNEPGAELYSAAADRAQSGLIKDTAAQMIRQDVELTRRARIMHSTIEYDDRAAIYRALSSEAGTKHGLNAHLVLIDELHAHKSRELRDVLVTSTGKREQPLVVYMTTSDYERISVCNEIWDHARRVRDGRVSDPAFLPALYEADLDDDMEDPAVWAKANPNLEGLHDQWSVPLWYMRRQCQRAVETPAYESQFKRWHLNIRTEASMRLVPSADWDSCSGHPVLSGPCFLGVDLSSTEDLTSYVGYWPETGAVVARFFIPSVGAVDREKRDRIPYTAWKREGHIELTEGNRVDYTVVRKRINEDRAAGWQVQDVGIDPWQSAHLMTDLQVDGFQVVAFPQGFREYNNPTKEVLRLLAIGGMSHGGNPILRYCAANVCAVTDSQGRIRPSKSGSSSTGRIDGFVALVMAVGRSMDTEPELGSVYDENELFVI